MAGINTIGKVIAGAVFVGGITFAGIAYTGSESVDKIKNMAANVQENFEQAVQDNNWLTEQFDLLESNYIADVEDANSKISGLSSNITGLNSQIADLNSQIETLTTAAGATAAEKEQLLLDKQALEAQVAQLEADKQQLQAELDAMIAAAEEETTDNETAQTELQNEVNRLEADLQQANTDIANLETYVAEVEAATQYTPVNKVEYTATDIAVERIPVYSTPEALAFDPVQAELMESYAAQLEAAYSSDFPVVINSVVVYNNSGTDVLAYEVDDASMDYLKSQGTSTSPNSAVIRTKEAITTGNLFFTNADKTQRTFINSWNRY